MPDGEVLRKQGGDAKENKKKEEGKKWRGEGRENTLKKTNSTNHKTNSWPLVAIQPHTSIPAFFLSVLPFFLCL